LSSIEEDPDRDPIHNGIDVGVVEDNDGGLASKFERALLNGLGRSDRNTASSGN